MPEDTGTGLEGVLDQLADYTLNAHNYQTIHNALNAENSIKIDAVNKLLSICIRALKEDMKYTVNTLNIILLVIKKVRDGHCVPVPDLVPSALAVLHLLQTTALFSKVEALKILCFDIIMSYPDETLISLAVNQNTEFMELFTSYCHQRIPIDIRLQPIHLVVKLLKILPPDRRRQFVKQGVSVWFSKIVPTIVLYINSPNAKVDVPIEAIEMLTEELVHIDYIDNPQWQIVLECIYTPQRYPSIMRSLLEKDNSAWSRLWIVFIRLLKNQITKVNNSIGSPINSMLPVVEMAFKMNAKNRCRAFECWNVLIDNFSTETSDLYINKRIKLLVIPLSSNNAKVVETAVAKLHTWWHLIVKFNSKLEKVAALALIPFLYFCFGKPNNDKPSLIPGMFSDELKYKCVEALVEIFGHISNCKCNISLRRLGEKLITQKLIVNHWKDWIHSIDNIIKIAAKCDSVEMKSRVKCVWFSFLTTIGDMTDSKLKRDLYYEVLSFLDKLCLDATKEITDVVLNILIPTLFDKDDKIASLKIKIDECSLEQKIISMLLRLPRDALIVRPATLNSIRTVTDHFLEDKSSLSLNTIEAVIKEVPAKGLLIWTALAESISKIKNINSTKVLCKMLLCPLENMDSITNTAETMTAWINLYDYVYPQHATINDDIFKILSLYSDDKLKNDSILIIAIAMLKQKVKQNTNNKDTSFNEELKFLLKVTSVHDSTEWINNDVNFKTVIQVIIDVLNKLMQEDDIKSLENVMNILKKILNQQIPHNILKESSMDKKIFGDLFKAIELTFKKEKYYSLKSTITNDLKDIGTKLLQVLESPQNNEPVLNIKTFIESIDVNSKTDLEKTETPTVPTNKVKFVEPETKIANKKAKKKQTTIVNTVMDHGEEYVVVKSNWKFNPKKLTDNQKEKLQRKREDIPALYQDLSQSQDEFKLSTWKTDSQDTSSTSKSTSVSANEDLSLILKNIPNSDIVPKILENMKSNNENHISKPNDESDIKQKNEDELKRLNNKATTPLTKETKSPRMALKDRVSRNVKNLIEKSNVPNGNISLSCETTVSEPKTPTLKRPQDSLINSAPPKISAERPCRQKRKPKKFEDLQLFGLKKRRHSSGQTDSPTDIDALESCENDNMEPKSSSSEEQTEQTMMDVKPTKDDDKTLEKSDNIVLLPENIEPLVNEDIKETKSSQNQAETDLVPNTEIETADEVPQKEITDIKNNINEDVNNEKEINNSSLEDFKIKMSTPKPKTREDKDSQVPKSSTKRSSKKSRIEKELAIDTVEGHPLLNAQSEKRVTRKRLMNTPNGRKSMTEKTNKNKQEHKSTKIDEKSKGKENLQLQKEETLISEDVPISQDVIESSQDSSITTISVKSTLSAKKTPIVLIDNLKVNTKVLDTQNLLEDLIDESKLEESKNKDKDDTDLPRNKTAMDDSTFIDLTENMDTEPITQNDVFDDVIIISDDQPEIVNINNTLNLESETQEIAEADTQSMDPSVTTELEKDVAHVTSDDANDSNCDNNEIESKNDTPKVGPNNITQSSDDIKDNEKPESSLIKDEEQRKKDFLNSTIEISPIKTLSPVGENKSSSQDTSADYVVIKLKSPVQSNGEPLEKCDSPEIFTEELKVSPDKRDLSPPREEVTVANTSPSSSLSLKKNRPQVRSGGRAAQMLGLCVPNRLQTIMLSDKATESEEKKSTPINTSARRNLRMLYGSTTENNNAAPEENGESENFLKLRRSLPSTDCSPSGPILKRKLVEITDDATVSPASKRKRVSFHDPPVSTTICVKKYIEPCGIRSPQNSAIKRQERQLRAQTATKSPKRLDNLFKLDTALTKTIESFVDESTPTTNEDIDMSSLDPTPIVEVVKTSELNDTDPICQELVDCRDSIENIALELSSATMKALLVKEFEGKINTIGDLAKMTELEINRLCIKAPKVQVARSVLNEYAQKIKQASEEITPTVEAAMSESIVPEFKAMEVQTNEILVDNVAVQTDVTIPSDKGTQSDILLTSHTSVQTDESGSKTTEDLVKSCLEREDFTQHLCEQTDETFKQKIADNLPVDPLTDILLKKMSPSNSTDVLNRVIDQISQNSNDTEDKLLLLKEYICNKFESKDLILFCSEILRKAYNKIT